MFYFHKRHSIHKRLLSIAMVFCVLPTIVWIDVLYDFFRDTVLMPLYYSICDECYIVMMLVFPIIALAFSVWGYCKSPKEDKNTSVFFIALSVALIVLMCYILSPLGEQPLV